MARALHNPRRSQAKKVYPFACIPISKLFFLELLTDYDMLLMFEARIRGGICQSIVKYAQPNNKYMKNYDKNVKSSHLEYLDASNLYRWAMCKNLPDLHGLKILKYIRKNS